MSEMVDLAIKQGEEMYKLGRKHEALEIKAKIEKEFGKLKGNSGCDYFTNNTIDTCMHIIMKILDNHIDENNQKESRCDICKWNDEELSGECYRCVKGIEDWYEPIEENKE